MKLFLLALWGAVRVHTLTWWRTRITCRCCASCAHWAPWASNNTVGQCTANLKTSSTTGKALPSWKTSGSYCKKWREQMR